MSTPTPVAAVPSAVRRWLVAGSLLSLTGSGSDPTGGGVRDALLAALVLTQRSGVTSADDVVTGLLGVLGNLGWVSSQVGAVRTSVPARTAPEDLLTAPDVDALAPAQHLTGAAARAWTGFLAAPGSRAALVVQGTSGTAPDPVLHLLHVDLTPAVPTAGFPWARVTAPGTLTRHTATLTPDTTLWTAAARTTLATKVSGVVASEVVDLR